MCLFPKLILNPRYLPNKKNGYNPPTLEDERLKYVAVGCGNCIECRKQKARSWQVRLAEELKVHKYCYFITLTYSDESLNDLSNRYDCTLVDFIASKSVRLFLERYRKKYKKSFKHWLITELGETSTERLHLHGIFFLDVPMTLDELQVLWSYGRADIGQYCNLRTINYIIKYVTKIDVKHKNFYPKIFCSSGLGRSFVDKQSTCLQYKFRGTQTREYYRLDSGYKVNLPIYYRNKLFTEKEREHLWLQRLEKHTIYIRGIKCVDVDTLQGDIIVNRVRLEQQNLNYSLGFGDGSKTWQKMNYDITFKMLNKKYSKKNRKKSK